MMLRILMVLVTLLAGCDAAVDTLATMTAPATMTAEDILAADIIAAAGGEVGLISISDEGVALVAYVNQPDDWGQKLGQVMAGIAQAGAGGVEIWQVVLTYGGAFSVPTGRVTVNYETIQAFIDGEMDGDAFNMRMMHTVQRGTAPQIVKPSD